jgi:hypothetical protein
MPAHAGGAARTGAGVRKPPKEDKTGESPPTTRETTFALMRDRLDDIDDLLRQDISPRELWARITDENVMRRELARALRDAGNQSYTIDQESE